MRWLSPKAWDERLVTKFLFFPLKIREECRWLERATFKQRYLSDCWTDVEWIN